MATKQPDSAAKQKGSPPSTNDTPVGGFSLLDLLRVLAGLLLFSAGTSWLITGNSFTWNYRPYYARWSTLKSLLAGPLLLTEEQLASYDGSDPKKPIYLALNGTIYDVSAGRKTYGPGGSYSFFAGKDAARAFLTGCFQEDLTGDLRGVEEMFVPVDVDDADAADGKQQPAASYDPIKARATPANPVDEKAHGKPKNDGPAKPLTKGQLKIRREQDNRIARKKMEAGIESWAKLFRGDKGKPYFEVGKVKREPGWPNNLPKRELCEAAQKARPKRPKQ